MGSLLEIGNGNVASFVLFPSTWGIVGGGPRWCLVVVVVVVVVEGVGFGGGR